MRWVSTLISSFLQKMIEVPESYCLIQLRVHMLVQPLSSLMSCSERSIWLKAQPTVAAQQSACHYPVSTANSTLHLYLYFSPTLPYAQTDFFFQLPTTHTHTQTQVENELSTSQGPEGKEQLKLFVMCHHITKTRTVVWLAI